MNALQYIKKEGLKNFSLEEWNNPEWCLKHTDSRLVIALDKFRSVGIEPSKHPEGWARLTGSPKSAHYALDRLSTAGDWFPSHSARQVFLQAIQSGLFGGLGFYTDTNGNTGKPQYMIHSDLRSGSLLWVRHRGEYYYPANGGEQEDMFWKVLANANAY